VRIYPVGRLDKDSEGLILMTNQGDLVNRLMRGSNGHEKEYLVFIDRPVKPEFIQKMRKGVFLPELDVTTKPCFAEMTGEKSFRIVLTQGLNRQIRRMCEQLGCKVRKLKRVRIMNIELGDLKAGESRPVSKKEYAELMRRLEDTSGLSLKDRTVNEKDRGKNEKGRNEDRKDRAKNEYGRNEDLKGRTKNEKGRTKNEKGRYEYAKGHTKNEKVWNEDPKYRTKNEKGRNEDQKYRTYNEKGRNEDTKGRTRNEKSRNENLEIRTDKRKKAPGKRK